MGAVNRTNGIIGAVGVILGLLLGMALFWGPFAVEWTDAQPYQLSPEARAEYVGLVADSFALYRDRDLAAGYLEKWTTEELQQAFSGAIDRYEAENRPEKVQAVEDLATVLDVSLVAEGELPPVEPPAESSLWARVRVPCLVFLVVLLVLVLGWVGFRILQGRRAEVASEPVIEPSAPPVERPQEWESAGQPPLGHFFTTYQLGEDTYDESFSIETAMGEFLGECGVGISDTIGEGDPDKVTAFEVWLFDKSDIRTVTKVLMSEHAFSDSTLRSKLSAKGDLVLAEPGAMLRLETTGLQVDIEVNEVTYGQGDEPSKSFFSKLTVELVASAKSSDSGGAL
jgi:hypothetical protein